MLSQPKCNQYCFDWPVLVQHVVLWRTCNTTISTRKWGIQWNRIFSFYGNSRIVAKGYGTHRRWWWWTAPAVDGSSRTPRTATRPAAAFLHQHRPPRVRPRDRHEVACTRVTRFWWEGSLRLARLRHDFLLNGESNTLSTNMVDTKVPVWSIHVSFSQSMLK